ncbi:AraC family transcriptional regulator [Planomonospora parontospora subsp. parontospora]|uniref:AraC family transcriptional regulator n=2 Tax=Planomonospora parontospora TaxID=58119 RepID=A0AA37F8N8_9ACTN|nr:helix-turn-helix domain-containing protein [Planomonospora parontospora]GGK99347.1 AraC family transcriptional regulator [Planomonospora parontospora]GII12977.1 AraC family transcriptional regulator [Planomonospora parontospora subsp. parontospora]
MPLDCPETPPTPSGPHRVVAVVAPNQELYPVTSASAVFGYHGPDIPQYYSFSLCAEHPGSLPTTIGVPIQVDRGLEALDAADTVVIASWTLTPSPAVLQAVSHAHARGARIVAVCAGIFVPAALGLLDGRRASVHWELSGELAARHPRVIPDDAVIYVDHGDVATAGASAATLDLCLHQVLQEYGAAHAMRIGRQLAAGPHREGCQRQYPPLPTTGPMPDSLAPLLEWLLSRLPDQITVGDMAAYSGVSSRTLTRQFTDQLGVPPARWLLERRLAATRALLEETDLPVETIATRVGLSSAVNLRRRFHTALRTTPAAYRRSFR